MKLSFLVSSLMLLAISIRKSEACNGEILVNGQVYIDPTGCLDTGYPTEAIVENRCDKVLQVYTDINCLGSVAGKVDPGQSLEVPNGSILVL
ncbi:uncharacterized protein BX664DRAFT_332262, partial [Halteromyces radiatus]|uniref:uncharacterized protein n=1 Tax=Halteromyces radiatus TaxID=101107 RepID=UPI0022200DA5